MATYVLKLDGYEDGRVELAADQDGSAAPELVKKAVAKLHPVKPTGHKPEKPEKPDQVRVKPTKPAGTPPGPVEPPIKPEKPKPKPDGNDPVDPFARPPG